MADKIEIFKLDIDVDAAIAGASQLKKEADALKAQMDALKKSGDTNSETYTRLKGAYDAVNAEYKVSQREVAKLTSLQNKEIKTIQQARNALSVVSSQWAKQAKLYGENSEAAIDLAKKKLALTNRLKELEKQTGDTSRNVGNYSEAITDAIGKNTLFGRAIGIVNDIIKVGKPLMKAYKMEIKGIAASYREGKAAAAGFSGAQKAAAISTNLISTALKIFRLALISTGIGAIIVLIGSLVAWFTKTQAGIDFVNKALAALGAAFDVITDRLSKFGGIIIGLITGQKSLSEAWNEGKEALSGIGDEMAREIALAIKLEEVLQAVEKAEVNLDIRRSAANTRLKELNKTIEDTTKSEKERLEAALEFSRLETSLAKEEVSNQEKRVAAMLGFAEITDEVRDKIALIGKEGVALSELGLSESTIEDAKEFRDEITKLFDLQTRSFEVQTTNQNKLNALIQQVRREEEAVAKARLEAQKKATDAAIKENKVRLKLFIEANKGEAKSLEKGLRFHEFVMNKRLSILDREVEAGKKTEAEAELEKFLITKDFLEKQKDLVLHFANEELQVYLNQHQSRIEAGQLLNDELVQLEVDRLNSIADKQKEFEAKRLENGVINQRQYNEAIDAIDEENRIARNAVELQYKEQKDAAEALEFETAQQLRIERDGDIYAAQLAQLERDYQAQIAYANKIGADTTKIEELKAHREKEIHREKNRARLSMAQDLFGGVAELLGQETKAGKAAGIAAATINTYQGVSEVWRAPSALPEPFGTIQKVVSTGIVLGSGLSAVKKIAATKTDVPKASKGLYIPEGGPLSGPSHSQGGIDIEAEGGEYILNRRATQLFYPLIDTMNRIGRGHTGLNTSGFFADGGLIGRTIQAPSVPGIPVSSPQIDYELLGATIAEANRSLPAPITDIKDVVREADNYTKIVDGASI